MNIGLVSCVKVKRTYKTQAQDLYISPLFRKAWNYVTKTYDRNYILSAKYGLLIPTTEIEPYDLTLNTFTEQEKKNWADMVYEQIKSEIGLNHVFYFHAGENYRKYLLDRLTYKLPLEGLGLGMQLQWYDTKERRYGFFS